MKQLLFLLSFIPIITFCQNDNNINWTDHQKPFNSENYKDALEVYIYHIEENLGCYFQTPPSFSDYSLPLRGPFCCSDAILESEAYSIRGEVYFHLGMYEKAISDFDKAIELAKPHPDKKGIYFNAEDKISRAYLYLKIGDYEKAISDLNSVIKLNPKYYYAYELRAIAYYFREEYDKSISNFNIVINNVIHMTSIDSYSNVNNLYMGRGYCYALNKDFENAMSDYRKAILFNPNNYNNDNALVHYLKGLLLESCELDPCRAYQKACDMGYDKGCEFYSSTKWFCQ